MKLSDYVVQFLIRQQVSHVFGYQGGAVTHLVDSLFRYSENIRFIGCCHEQAAAFAAEGYARAGEKLGVALATSGPGATNLITGIGSAYFDSIPCLYLTGQVNTYEYKGELAIRQRGFQETDIVSIVKPITKYALRITDPGRIRLELERAVHTALSGRPGPVLLDLPMDIQRAEIDEQQLTGWEGNKEPIYDALSEKVLDNTLRLLELSSRPVILVGGGVRLSRASAVLNRISARLSIPVVTSLMGRDGVDNSLKGYVGMIGAYGNRYANLTLANSDFLLVLGSRLDTRQTGTLPETFARDARIVRVDIDAEELSRKIRPEEQGVLAPVKEFLEALEERMDVWEGLWNHPVRTDSWNSWLIRVQEYKQSYPTEKAGAFSDPNFVVGELGILAGKGELFCLDVGQNQMWAAQSLNLSEGGRLLTSGGMGSMGFSLPCAIGAYYAGGRSRVFALCGDGGVQMNIQELALIKKNRLPIKIIVLNNQSLGMIRHFQEMYFDSRFCATVEDYALPDFCAVARGYGIESRRVSGFSELHNAKELLENGEPVLIEIMLPEKTYVLPKLPVNHPIEAQDPPLSLMEIEKVMVVKPLEQDAKTMNFRQLVKETLDKMKRHSAKEALLCLPVLDDRGELAGFLRPITWDYRDTMEGLGELLSRWRNENPLLSASPFKATAEGTEAWLDKQVLAREDRILFLISEKNGRLVGHIGFSSFNYEEKGCEVDAVLRGEKNGCPGIMTHSLKALIRWGLDALKLEKISLRVLSHNLHAIRFYEKNGFNVTEEGLPAGLLNSIPVFFTAMVLDLEGWKQKEMDKAPSEAKKEEDRTNTESEETNNGIYTGKSN